MSQAMIAFCSGLVVGLPLGILLISLLIMSNEEHPAVERVTVAFNDCPQGDCRAMSLRYGQLGEPEFYGPDQRQDLQK